MTERWSFIADIPHTYLVSDRGRVYSVRSQRILSPSKSGFVLIYVNKNPIPYKVENLVRSTFGFACNLCECETAANCWRCGFNPDVDDARKRLLRERGMKIEQSIATFHLDKSVLEKGWTDIENILPQKGEKTNDWK